MSQKIQGDLEVARTLSARRANLGMEARTITAQESLAAHDPQWVRLSAAAAQDAVLPDATSLPNGWSIVLEANGASTVTAKTYHASTPVLLQAISAGDAWALTLLDNGTAAGTWHANKLESTSTAARYSETFDATTDWGTAASGYYAVSVDAATHGVSSHPSVKLYEADGSDYVEVLPDRTKILANNNVEIRVTETPDARFAGKLVIS